MKKKNSAFFQASRLILSFIIAVSISLMAVTPASAAITNPQAWSRVYGGAAYPGTYAYSVPAASNRLLVVAVSSTRSTAGTQTATVTYGGQTLTPSVGDAAAPAQQHSYLFYLDDAGIAAAVGTNLIVTVSGGTSLYNNVYAAVYAGIDQTAPITNSQNYSNSTANTAVGPFTTALTIGSGDLALEIVNITRSSAFNLAARTISSWAANWSPSLGPNSDPDGGYRQTAYIATNSTAGTTTSQHTASGDCWDSMSAMTLNSKIPPAFTSADHTTVAVGQNQTFIVTAVGFPPPTFSLAEVLPTGMTFDPATGILTGAPDPGEEATYSLTFTAANGVLPNATQDFTLTVAPAFPVNWQFRKCHDITSAVGAGTGYQVRITVHYGTGTDSGEDVYLNNHCRTDFEDIRFVSSDQFTELKYWVEEPVSTGGSAVFWVKVANDLSVNQRIYLYYGNAAATTTADGLATFEFFDDFNGTLDTTTKWAIQQAQTVYPRIESDVTASYLRNGDGVNSGSYGWTCLGSQPSYSSFQNNAVEFRYRVADDAISEVSFRGDFAANTGYKGRSDQRAPEGQSFLYNPYQVGGWVIITPPGQDGSSFIPAIDTWYRGTITAFDTAFNTALNYYRDDTLMRTVDVVNSVPPFNAANPPRYTGSGQISLQNHYGSYTDYDWVSVRKFVSPEPAHAFWCEEENLLPALTVTKSVALRIDGPPADQVVSIGDTLRYNVKIRNNGIVPLLGVEFTDPVPPDTFPPSNTTYTSSPGSVTASSGTVSDNGGAGPITWTGNVAPGALIVITFDVTVNPLTPVGTLISNQGHVFYDSDNDGDNDTYLLTDGNPLASEIQKTNIAVGGSAHGFGTKTASLAIDEDGNGVISAGDTLEYEIVIANYSGFIAAAPLEFTDAIPAYTTYVPDSTTVTDFEMPSGLPNPPYSGEHDPVITEPTLLDPTLKITGIDIGAAPPANVITITFQVKLDDPMAPGVTEIHNQADVFYDSDSDGLNDTHQSTDGDGNPNNGNQPTVSFLTLHTISGTVFDDLNNNNTPDSGEGIVGVEVNLWDALFTLLYGYGPVYTGPNGDYIFTNLPAGDYGVEVTDPPLYAPTLSNRATVTLPPNDTDVNFDYQIYADLSITKNCVPLRLDGTDQLVFEITVTNRGPNDLDAADNAELFDDLDALATAGLTNIKYTVGGVLPALDWPATNTVPLDDILSGDSKVIRIFAVVPPTFVPEENAASVTSDIFDPDTGNNAASCTPEEILAGRMAMEFIPASSRSITVPSSTSLESISAKGTVEAWIYVKEFNANSELIGKGTSEETFNIGFLGGAAQNIGFTLYDTSGTQHPLIADNYTLNANKWYHIACVWDVDADPEMAIYINGVEEKTGSPGIDAVRINTEDLIIGVNHLTAGRFIGIIDEVRVWNVARTPSRIQETMCHKLTSSETTDYDDLMGNWRFDEIMGNPFCDDISKFGNLGYNNAARVCSSAPIGDSSKSDYEESDDFRVEFPYTAKDELLTVSAEVDADWTELLKSGLQVYRVNVTAEEQSGPIGTRLLTDIGYWGVFVTGGAGPTYTIEYNYDFNDNGGIPGVGNEADLRLNWRHGNCEIWKSLDAISGLTDIPPTNTLTKGGLSGTEFILGTDLPPRNAILFDGANDYVNVPDGASLDLTTDGTIEAWIYITTDPVQGGSIINKTDGADGYNLSINNTGNVVFTLYGGGSDSVASGATLAPNTWYHIAATWDNDVDVMNLYVNGVLDPNPPYGSPQESGSTAGSPLTIGGNGTTGFQGRIDEVRVWNAARNQAAIRDTMCKKVTSADSGYANLVGYWRFDEETSITNCPDFTAYNNDGTMFSFADVPAARICSAAPIGDYSAYNYDATPTVTLNPTATGGSFQATAAAAWAGPGIHVYRLDEAPVYGPHLWTTAPYSYLSPNGLTPPVGPPAWSSIDYYRYFGVFVTSPAAGLTYNIAYDYTTNPMTPDDDSVVGLARREAYCDRYWMDSGAGWVSPVLTLNSDDQNTPPTDPFMGSKQNPEYIFGGKDAPLAITLASFTATPDNGCVEIAWETATEINTAGFHVWRSDNPFTGFVRITGSMITSTSEMETIGSEYSFQDCGVDFSTGAKYYYMLEEIEMDTTGSGNMHGPIGPVTEAIAAAQGGKNDDNSNCFIDTLR